MTHRDDRQHPTEGPAAVVLRSLTEILHFLRALEVNPTRVRSQDIDFAYAAMFENSWSDPEIEQLRAGFLQAIGPESAHHLCRYALHHCVVDRFADGFTDDELASLLGRLTIAIVLLLHHQDLARDDVRLEVGITVDGVLHARVPHDEALAL